MSTHNLCFHGKIRKKKKKHQYFWVDLFQAILSNLFTFIGHKSRMTQIDSFEFISV